MTDSPVLDRAGRSAVATAAAPVPAVAPPSDAAPHAVLRGTRRPDLLRDELLAEVFRAAAARAPEARALVEGARTVTYAELDAWSDGLARGLARRGVGPGDVVGLWLPRGAEALACQLAITKTGAAWLPFDPEAPPERVAVCLEDAGAKGLLTADEWAGGRAAATGADLFLPAAMVDSTDDSDLDPRARGATPASPAYVIYTSGSTGVPKGIVITQGNICHYLRSANSQFEVRADDVVLQAGSLAFDLSLEEVWVPYLAGACLWVADATTLSEVDRLPDRLADAGVTVVDMVPTLLALLPTDVPSLRLIILGGEALPPRLVERWAAPGRRLLNTYGPTEATVVATMCEARPGEPVTIGGPLPNYSCYVADEAMNPLPRGRQGELLIGGPGVAAGYLKRDALTADRFVPNPFPSDGLDPVLYRSGDAVTVDEGGLIHFQGRIDDQVKVRGFRVELGEIESRIAALPGVSRAAVVLRSDGGVEQLVAFLVPEGSAPLDQRALRAKLREELPPYMVPARFEAVDAVPRLTSGKVDRKALRAMPLSAGEAEAQEEPATPAEAALLAAAQGVFPGQSIPLEADFFTELGGHSLIAAQFVSALRASPALAHATLQTVYAQRSLRAMAAALEPGMPAPGAAAADLAFAPTPLRRRLLCGLAQAAALPFILALMTAQWLGVFVSYMLISGEGAGLLAETVTLLAVYGCINVFTLGFVLAAKWVIIGRTKPGTYPLWGAYYFRLWLVQRLVSLVHLKWMQGSPVMRWYLRMLGAHIGPDALIADVESGAFDLVSVGARAALGDKVKLATVEVVGNEVRVGRVSIGADAVIGSSCVIEYGSSVGEGAELADLTALSGGTRVGAWESWDGTPGRKVGTVDEASLPEAATASPARRRVQGALYALALLIVPPIGLLPIVPAFYLFDRIQNGFEAATGVGYQWFLPLMAWPTAMALVALTVLLIAVVRWVVLPRVRAGTHSVHSWFYLRKWVVALATEVTLETLSSLYATVYMRAWYRLMGARIGKDAEISTNLAGRYDLVEIGPKCFIADEVILGDEEVRRGWMTLKPVVTGARVFVGNSAVVPPGTTIGEGALIGVKSKPPGPVVAPGAIWFGSPPIELPNRQRVTGLPEAWTFEPSRWRRLGRGTFEAFNLSLPTMLFITFGTLAVDQMEAPIAEGRWLAVALIFLASAVVIPSLMTLVVAGIKWALMGRYVPVIKPMWSWWALRTEAVAVMYWGLAGKVLLDHLRGTPFLPWVLRLFGTRTGQGVYMDTTDITEFDCVTIGDFAAINASVMLQTHLYEDRVMKVGRIRIGRGVTLGAGATVLYDTHVGDHAQLGPETLVMKGESIPAHSRWEGAPAQPAGAH